MTKHKHTTLLCIIISVVMVLITVLYVAGSSLGLTVVKAEMPYTQSLFSTDSVHTLDIVVEEADWQELLDNAQSKEYISCNVIIDKELFKNVAIRTKGNSTLTTMVSSDTDRYSFKIEFDHYDSTQNYYGLDKLALNNIAQDNTYLKDYLSYQMMNAFGASAPLCSFIDITVNGADFGLYLAVEGVEDSFIQLTSLRVIRRTALQAGQHGYDGSWK